MAIISGSYPLNIAATITNCQVGDQITFELISEYHPASNNYTASISAASLNIDVLPVIQGSYTYATSSQVTPGNFISGADATHIVFSSALSGYYPDYQQIPYFISGSTDNQVTITGSLYQQYGDIDYIFNPVLGDKVVLKDHGGATQVVTVLSVAKDSVGRLSIEVTPQLLASFVSDPTTIDQLLVVKKLQDEQNVIVRFTKRAGQTSYGFIIPENINPSVLKSINTIQAQVQQQLLSTQANTG